MTDPSDPNQLDPLDDLASAHLDGQTTADEDARVATDPALAARVAALAAVRDAVRAEGIAVDEVRREDAIAAALAAFDDDAAGASSSAGAGGATPIAVAAARRRVSRRSLQVIGAVAVAVVLAVAVPLLGALDSDSDRDEDVATSALEESATVDDSGAERAGDAAGGVADAQAPTVGTFSTPTGVPIDFGSFEDLEQLDAAVGAYLPPLPASAGDMATASTTARAVEAADACPDEPDAGTRVLAGTATVDGRPVLVRVFERPAGERDVVVLDAADCTVLSS